MNHRRAILPSLLPAPALLLCGLVLAGPLPAQPAPERPSERVIRVTGTGEVLATPDEAHIDLAVETTGATAQAASEQNAQQMDRVIRALTAAGVPRTEIQTRGYALFPVYEQPDRPMPRVEGVPEQPRIVGYRAMNLVSVRTHDLTRVGPIIDRALGAGANRLDGLRFSLRDAEAAQNQALRQASERARRSAEAIAAALGVRLGPVAEASTVTDMVGPVVQFDRAMAREMAAAPTPIQPGEQTVRVSITVAFAIAGS